MPGPAGRATGDSRSPIERGHAGLPRHPLAADFEQGIFSAERKRIERRRILPADARRPGGDVCRGHDPATYHRYMWLWKPHYYAHDHNFYNFPYAFGHLFSLGLYAIYRQTGPAFVPRYDALLRATNQDYPPLWPPVSASTSPTIDFW